MAANSLIDVEGFSIGGAECFVIAEIGSNHVQDMSLAREHIDVAVDCGANAVKFQSIQLDELYLNPSEDAAKLVNSLQMDEDWIQPLKDYCREKGIVFFSSPTYLRAVDALQRADVSLYKLASAQVGTFPELVRRVAGTGRPALLSCGIATSSDIERAIEDFEAAGNPNYVLLHCNSMYPTPADRVDLGMMEVYRNFYRCVVGFSDHTDDIHVPIAAVAHGAKVIEKHFTLSRDLPSPDAVLSIEPGRFSEMVRGIRSAEAAMRPGRRIALEDEEEAFKQDILYRLVLDRDVAEGELLRKEDFQFLRHHDGVDCRELDFLLSRRATAARGLARGELLHWHAVRLS